MKKTVVLFVCIFLVPLSYGKLFELPTVTPPFFGCSITGCTMQGPINMSGYPIYDAALVNPSLVEYDPIFNAWLGSTYSPENISIWNAINSKLNITDQRYNDTALILWINDTIWIELDTKLNITDQRYNDTGMITEVNNTLYQYIQNITLDLDNKLNITDQRYNDTLLIEAVNTSIWQELALKLNITDQRYNDTQFILDQLLNYYNKTEIDFLFANFTYNETDPVFTAENISIWLAINTKLNETDQRYNDTQFILDQLLNYYNKTESDARYLQNETDPVFTAENSSIWLAINNKLNESDQRYNDTAFILNELLNYYNITEIDAFFTYYYNKTEVDDFLALKLNITDQRYNDTAFILNELLNYYNITEIDYLLSNISLTPGPPGTNGTDGINGTSVTITNIVDNLDGTYTWQFSDGYNFTTSNLTGPQGIPGIDGINGTNGIDGTNGTSVNMSSIVNNGDGTYTWYFSDGYNFTTGNLTGPQGIQGIQGINGTDGVNGTSVNITTVIDNFDGTFTWVFSDGTNFTTSNLTGPQGIPGIDGINGTNGIDGVNGTSVTFVNITEDGGVFTWYFSDGFNYTTSNLTGPQGIPGTDGINGTDGVNGTSFDVSGPYLYNNGSNVIFFNQSYLYVEFYTKLETYNQTEIDGFLSGKLNVTDQRYNDTILIYEVINWTNNTFYPTTNPAGYINASYANSSFYPLNDNPAGYLTNDTLLNITSPWVLKAGDNMTGNLNMSNNSILGVDVLEVHNITGRSPIFINSPMISFENITATNFYGNINGQNGTIFGMTITNGTITNMHVSDSAVFNTSLLPELNDTWSLGNENLSWKNFYVGTLYAGNISSSNIHQYYADQIWIYRTQYGNTTDYIFYFNESLLNLTLQAVLSNYYNKTEVDMLINNISLTPGPPGINGTDGVNGTSVNMSSIVNNGDGTYTWYFSDGYNFTTGNLTGPQGIQGFNGTNGIDGTNGTSFDVSGPYLYDNGSNVIFFNDTLLQAFNDTQLAYDINTSIWIELDNKLNITDQRYNDTLLIYEVNQTLYLVLDTKLNITDQRYNDTQYIINLLLNYYNKTETDILLDNKLNITDQRYNDTQLITDVNTSIWNELALKLNITDQRYNDTAYIVNLLLDYYNKTEIDNMLSSYIQNETDPVFTAENTTIWNAINSKLNITDQRYNDTQYIINALLNYYNKTEVDNLLDAKLNITDQRYNDTDLINSVNQSIWNELALKLNISDQRYNDTQYIINQLLNYYNKTESDARYIQNETDPVFTAENTSIWNAINSKLNISDQRYNDTQYIINALMNYYNKTETDNLLDNKLNITDQRYNDTVLINSVNQSIWNELALKLNITDQRYNDTLLIYAVNDSVYIALDGKLNITDQRYNDTAYINNLIANYYNKTEIDIFLEGKLNTTDQRYNDTALINSVNSSLWIELALKLNITDQRYNDTAYIVNLLLDYYNKTEIDAMFANFTWNETDPIFQIENATIWAAINSKLNETDQRYNDTALIVAVNTSVWNELNNKLNITDQRYNDTALIYAVNTSVWNELNNKLNITDQRYNDTALIYIVNTSVWNELALKLNISDQRYNDTGLIYAVNTSLWLALDDKLNITDQRYNETYLIQLVNATIKQPTGPYLAYDNTTFWINETALNITINNISKVRKITYNMTCTTVAGTCNVTSTINISYQITEVKVIPITSTNSYKFLLTEYPNTALIIDQDRATHVGTWDIEKSYAINGQVQANITNANINELFTVSIIYLTNGVQ